MPQHKKDFDPAHLAAESLRALGGKVGEYITGRYPLAELPSQFEVDVPLAVAEERIVDITTKAKKFLQDEFPGQDSITYSIILTDVPTMVRRPDISTTSLLPNLDMLNPKEVKLSLRISNFRSSQTHFTWLSTLHPATEQTHPGNTLTMTVDENARPGQRLTFSPSLDAIPVYDQGKNKALNEIARETTVLLSVYNPSFFRRTFEGSLSNHAWKKGFKRYKRQRYLLNPH